MPKLNTLTYQAPAIAGFFMAAIAGFSDVFSFIALDRLFTAHVTGNIIIAIAFLIYHVRGVAAKLIAIPLFIVVTCLISLAIETHGLQKRSLCFWLLVEVLLFAALLVLGILFIPHFDVTTPVYIAISMLPVSAMAIHNALMRSYMAHFPPCTVMTGNLSQFVLDFVAFVAHPVFKRVERREIAINKMKRFGNVLFGFAVGALLGCLGFVITGFWSLLIIIGMLLMLVAVLVFYDSLKLIGIKYASLNCQPKSVT